MYTTYKICARTVAAAEDAGELSSFVQWLIKQKACSPNLTNLSMAGIPKGAGNKGGVPNRSRKRKRQTVRSNKAVVDRLNPATPISVSSSTTVVMPRWAEPRGIQ